MTIGRALLITVLLCVQTPARCGVDITDAEANRLCEKFLALANSGKLEQQAIQGQSIAISEIEPVDWDAPESLTVFRAERVQLDQQQEPEILGFTTGGGSCSTNLVVTTSDPESPRNRYRYTTNDVERNEVLRWVEWGTSQRLFLVEDQVLLASLRSLNSASLPNFLWLWNDGEPFPLCAFEGTGESRLEVLTSENDRLCRRVARREIETIKWQEAGPIDQDAVADYFGARAEDSREVVVDLDGDGQPERLVAMTYHSGAGCGASYEFAAVLTETGAPASSPLNQYFAPARPYNRYRRDTATLNTVFVHDGLVHVFGRVDSELGLFTFAGQQKKNVCTFQSFPQSRISVPFPPNQTVEVQSD